MDNGKHTYYPIKPEGREELDRIKKENPNVDPYEMSYIIDHYAKKERGGYIPTDSVVINVDKEAVKASGMWLPDSLDLIPDKMVISLKGALEKQGGLYRQDLMIYEMLAHADWKRPMYMSVTLGPGNYAGLENFLILEGLAYRITPFNFGQMGMIDSELMYKNMMTRFKFGNVKQPGIYLDETVGRMCQTHRRMFTTLASNLLRKGDKARALKVLQKCEEELPATTIPYTDDESQLSVLWLEAGNKKEATRVAKEVLDYDLKYLTYLNSLGSAHIQTYRRTTYFLVMSIIEASRSLMESDAAQYAVYQKRIDHISRTEAFALGFETYQSQMQQ